MTPFGTFATYGRPAFNRFKASPNATRLSRTFGTASAASRGVLAAQNALKAPSTLGVWAPASVRAAKSRAVDAQTSRVIGTTLHLGAFPVVASGRWLVSSGGSA